MFWMLFATACSSGDLRENWHFREPRHKFSACYSIIDGKTGFKCQVKLLKARSMPVYTLHVPSIYVICTAVFYWAILSARDTWWWSQDLLESPAWLVPQGRIPLPLPVFCSSLTASKIYLTFITALTSPRDSLCLIILIYCWRLCYFL